MAQIKQVTLVDDFDGSVAQDSHEFSFGGRTYEIDLNEKNGAKLTKALEALAPFVEKARRVQPKGAKVAASNGDKRSYAPRRSAEEIAAEKLHRAEVKAAREWAKANGQDVKDRGRLDPAIVEAWRAETGGLSQEPEVEAPADAAALTPEFATA